MSGSFHFGIAPSSSLKGIFLGEGLRTLNYDLTLVYDESLIPETKDKKAKFIDDSRRGPFRPRRVIQPLSLSDSRNGNRKGKTLSAFFRLEGHW